MAKDFNTIKTEINQDDRVTFGKHTGMTWFWVSENYPDYIIWCVGNTDHKFSYQLIVDSIKSKYRIKKATKTEEVDGMYDPVVNSTHENPYKAHAPNRTFDSFLGSVFQKHHGDSFGSHHSDDWDDDIPF